MRDKVVKLKRQRADDHDNWPKPLGRDAYHGLTGQFVDLVLPQTEADPANLAFTFLTMFGNSVGRNPYMEIDGAEHCANEYVLLIGRTSRGRKGTGEKRVRRFFYSSEEQSNQAVSWLPTTIFGMSTGEGLIAQFVPEKDKDGNPTTTDMRRLVVDSEFGRSLIVMGRPGNTLSAMVRTAWDSGTLQLPVRNNPLYVEGAHLSIIGHSTIDELKDLLSTVQLYNGFGNRFLFAMTKRSKELPDGGGSINYRKLVPELSKALGNATSERVEIGRSKIFCELWPECYSRLTAERPGVFGAATARAEAHVMRLSMIYALLDQQKVINDKHLRAALEIWRYSEDSVRYLYGTDLGDEIADLILDELKRQSKGMTRSEISREVFGGNREAGKIKTALDKLESYKLVTWKDEKTEGAIRRTYFASKPNSSNSSNS